MNGRAAFYATVALCVGIVALCLVCVAAVGLLYVLTWLVTKANGNPEILVLLAVPVMLVVFWWELYNRFKEEES